MINSIGVVQSHYIEVVQGAIFMEAEYEIWADFGLVGNTEKIIWGRLWATFEGSFSCFHGQKQKMLNLLKLLGNPIIVVSALKSCIIPLL